MSVIHPSVLTKAAQGKRLLIDTNIIVYLTDAIKPYNALSRLLFEMVEKGDAFAVFSIVSIAETMQGPLRKGLRQNAQDLENYLMNFPNATCQEITVDVLPHIGMDTRIDWSRLRTADSLIIASGMLNDVELVISNDLHFKKALPKDFILTFDK